MTESPVTESNTSRIADAIAEAARIINAPLTVEERLEEAVRAATRTVPGFDQVSISLAHRDGSVETRVASSDLVEKLDLDQYRAGEGPCFEAFAGPAVILVPSVRDEPRWAPYISAANQAGVTAQMAVPLGHGGDVRGALNLYSTTGEGIDPDAPGVAVLYATHVTLALGWARTEEQLNEALATRKVIGQAIGIVMERYQINESKAFAFFTRVSQTSNLKLRTVAQELVTQTDTRYTIKDT